MDNKSKKSKFSPFDFLFISLLLFANSNRYTSALRKTNLYIVYMGSRQHDDVELITSSHHDILASVLGSRESAKDAIIYSYKHGFSGFAAMMTESQAQTIADVPGVVKVMRNHLYKMKTTGSYDYLGQSLNSATNLLHDTKMGDGIIVGVFDSGVTPENESFNDKGLGPIPSKWKGRCESGVKFNATKDCNRKLIGARYFIDGFLAAIGNRPGNYTGIYDYVSPRDSNGHGTHCAGTAVGSPVQNVSYKGLALGTARGGAPRARLAVYKIGWENGLISGSDVLQAFDEAIHDGVDVISASFGVDVPLYSEVDQHDPLHFGSFHAVTKGITIVAAGGNEGSVAGTVSNASPWLLTVAACTHDRAFPTPITLGNGQTFMGQSLLAGKDTGIVDLFYPENTPCEAIQPNERLIAGNVVLCFTGQNGLDPQISGIVSAARYFVKMAGGLGIIVAQQPVTLLDEYNDDFPSVQVDYEVGTKILLYFRSTRNPKVRLSPSKTQIGKPISGVVAKYSSRGPYTLSPSILKPDIAAPGTNILAAYISNDPAKPSAYAFLSGTSMATPHIVGIVALLKAGHPDWSPAAIKSAIVTTGWTTDPSSGEPIFSEGETMTKLADGFDYGGGIVNPNGATDPGLVYDMGTIDYVHYLCAMGYGHVAISIIAGKFTTCPKEFSVLNVNLPSITVPSLNGSVTLTRTVTNVGPVKSKYRVVIEQPKGISVQVKPGTLNFSARVKKISFIVTITTSYRFNTGYYFGSLTWNDGEHNVRIPISVKAQY